MQTQPVKIVVIVGPTASGKSGLAIRLAKRLKGEVISADSRQVYKGLDIGTGKVTKKEMAGVPHHLLDVASPKKKFSAGDFIQRGHKAIADISARGKHPIIAGGTGFYIDALMGRIDLPEIAPNPALRKKLAGKSASQLFAMLKKKDPKRARMMDTPSESNNAVRLIRALEIAAAAKPKGTKIPAHSYNMLWIGISPSMTVLEKKIRTRLLDRIKIGMVAEARRLKKQGVSYKRMRELGLEYRSLADLLEKNITKEEFIETLYSEIRRYARKQTGYWNRNKDIEWFDPKDVKKIETLVSSWLAK
jgi:tRNA dimethylallyltransferase